MLDMLFAKRFDSYEHFGGDTELKCNLTNLAFRYGRLHAVRRRGP